MPVKPKKVPALKPPARRTYNPETGTWDLTPEIEESLARSSQPVQQDASLPQDQAPPPNLTPGDSVTPPPTVQSAPAGAPPPLTAPMPDIHPPSQLETQQQNVADAVAEPVQKQGAGSQALWWALQGIRETFNPGSGNLKYLGQAKHDYEVARQQGQLAPLLKLEDDRLGLQKGQAQVAGLEANVEGQKIENAYAANPWINQDLKAGSVTPEAVKNAPGNIHLQPRDYAPRDYQNINGQLHGITNRGQGPEASPVKGAPPDLGTSPSIPRVDAQSGAQYNITPREATAENIAGIRKQGTDRAPIAADINRVNDFKKEKAKWEAREVKRQSEVAKKTKLLEAKKAQIQAAVERVHQLGQMVSQEEAKGLMGNGQEVLKQQQTAMDEVNKLKNELDILNSEISSSQPEPAPPEPTLEATTERNTPKKRISRAELEKVAKRKKTTVEELLKLPGAEEYEVQ